MKLHAFALIARAVQRFARRHPEAVPTIAGEAAVFFAAIAAAEKASDARARRADRARVTPKGGR